MSEPRLISCATGLPMATKLSEITPGEWAATTVHPNDVPRYGIVRMMRQTDGSYIPVLKSHSQYVRMHRELPAAIGLKDLSPQCFYRLVLSGFVAGSCPSPGVVMLDLASLFEHIEAARDPEFWTPERRKRWSAAIGETHRTGGRAPEDRKMKKS